MYCLLTRTSPKVIFPWLGSRYAESFSDSLFLVAHFERLGKSRCDLDIQSYRKLCAFYFRTVLLAVFKALLYMSWSSNNLPETLIQDSSTLSSLRSKRRSFETSPSRSYWTSSWVLLSCCNLYQPKIAFLHARKEIAQIHPCTKGGADPPATSHRTQTKWYRKNMLWNCLQLRYLSKICYPLPTKNVLMLYVCEALSNDV